MAMLGSGSHMNGPFWQYLEELLDASDLIIDRPRGSGHPRYPTLIYPLDYGYLEGTSAVDGDGVDVWLGSLPEKRLSGLICTVDLVNRDAEIKLLVGCSAVERRTALGFLNQGSMAAILIERDQP